MFKQYLLSVPIVLATLLPVQAQHQPLRNEIERLARSTSGKVGVAIRLLETNDTLTYHNQQPYVLQSVFKLAVAMAVLHEVDRGKLRLAHPVFITKADLPATYSPLRYKYLAGNVQVSVQDLLTYVMTVSDNAACEILLKLLGGPQKVNRYVHRLGIKGLAINASKA